MSRMITSEGAPQNLAITLIENSKFPEAIKFLQLNTPVWTNLDGWAGYTTKWR